MVLASTIDERTTIPLGTVWVILGAFVAACLLIIPGVFKIGYYTKGIKDAIEAVKIQAEAATVAAKEAVRQAAEARKQMQISIGNLPCNTSRTVLPNTCTRPED